jgi:hypothetical protein
MPNELAAVTEQLNVLLARIERGEAPERSRLEETLTDGYACALSLDAQCDRLERRIADHAAKLTAESGEEQMRELSAVARMLRRRRRELDSIRGLLAVLRASAHETRIA